MILNPQQQEAVSHRTGSCLVVSVPGSGKTRVIVERTVALIRSGVEPHNILSLTFTNKAANEMKGRISLAMGGSPSRMFVGTFHSLCSHVIRKFPSACGLPSRFSILDESDQILLIRKVAKRIHGESVDLIDPKLVAAAANNVRENCGDLEEDAMAIFCGALQDESVAELHLQSMQEYLQECKAKGLIDFSGLLYEVISLMESNDTLRKFLQNSHQFLQVDEVQDTNLAQFKLVEMLGEKHGNIFVVGDINQSIYGWRGARYHNILDFMNRQGGCKVVELGRNYRSTARIASVADALIKHNTSNIGSGIKTVKGDGKPVLYKEFKTSEEEADCIASNAKSWLSSGMCKAGDIAVLYRVNSMSRALEEAFRRNGVPYKVIGGFSFYDRAEIRDCLAMLRMCVNPRDSVAFARIAEFMPGMGSKSVLTIEHQAADRGMTIPAACMHEINSLPSSARRSCQAFTDVYLGNFSSLNAGQALQHIVGLLNYREILAKSKKTNPEDRIANVQELITSAMSGENKDLNIQEYLHRMQLMTSGDEESQDSQVSLMTMHASKGLEFQTVFVVGIEENMIPHEKSLAESPDAVEEERRLLYVAMTRAMDRLLLSSCRYRKRAGGKSAIVYKTYPSRFLVESGVRIK